MQWIAIIMESMSMLCLGVKCTDTQIKHWFVKRNTEISNEKTRNACSSSIFAGNKVVSSSAIFIFSLPRVSLCYSHTALFQTIQRLMHTHSKALHHICVYLFMSATILMKCHGKLQQWAIIPDKKVKCTCYSFQVTLSILLINLSEA